MLITVFFTLLASSLITESQGASVNPPRDHRYVFPNGNELVFVPGRPGLRLERGGTVIQSFPELRFPIKVFPSTDTATGVSGAGNPNATFIREVPSSPLVLFEAAIKTPSVEESWIISMNQEGQFNLVMPNRAPALPSLRLKKELSSPHWEQFHLREGKHTYVLLAEPSPEPYNPFYTIHALRDDLPDVDLDWAIRPKGTLNPRFVDGMLVMENGAPPEDIIEEFEAAALEDPELQKTRKVNRVMQEDLRKQAKLSAAEEASFAGRILPRFEKGLDIIEHNTDLETARTFTALKRPHERVIPTLLRIAQEKPAAAPARGVPPVNRPLRATELLAEYAELDPRAIDALERIATAGGNEKARQVAQAKAKSLRKGLLPGEGQAVLKRCMQGYRAL